MSREIDDYRFNFFLTVFLFAVVIGATIGFTNNLSGSSSLESVDRVEVAENSLSLYSGCFRLDMGISGDQSRAIQGAGVDTDRPLTFDFFSSTIDQLNADLDRVVIHGMEDGAFLADSVFERRYFGEVRVDARPSDSIALAESSQADILVERDVLTSYGEYFCSSEDVSII